MTEHIKFWDAKTREVSEIPWPRMYTFYQAVQLSSASARRKFAVFRTDDHDNWQLSDVFTHGNHAWWTWDGEDALPGESPTISWDDFYARYVEVTGNEADGYVIVDDSECACLSWPNLGWEVKVQ